MLSGTPRDIFAQKQQIRALGLELPVPTTIADELKENGIDLKEDAMTENDLVNSLISWSEGVCR